MLFNREMEDILELEYWKEKLGILMKEGVYLDLGLSLQDFVIQLYINFFVFFKIINNGFGMNFNDFINFYWVEVIKDKLCVGEY